MPKPHPIQINIPNPCHQKWEEMTPCGQGRFCGHCQKTVIDFSTWSDTALYDFFAKRREKVCGRFLPSQLNRNINIPLQPHSRLYGLTIALGLTLIFTQGTSVYAQNKPPLAVQTIPTPYPKNSNREIRGLVVDEKEEPIINATIQVYLNGILKGGNVSDFDGVYYIGPLDTGHYDVYVRCPNYSTAVVTNVLFSTNYIIRIKATLSTIITDTVIAEYKELSTHSSEKIGRGIEIFKDNPSTTIRPEDIRFFPTGAMGDLTGLSPALYQSQRGKGTSIPDGARATGTLYRIDGVNISENQPDKPVKKKKRRWHLFRKQP
jgi:hypothetical protein